MNRNDFEVFEGQETKSNELSPEVMRREIRNGEIDTTINLSSIPHSSLNRNPK